MNSTGNNIRVLIAPLDWGLGHATRCVPIIGELQELGCEIVLAADGKVAKLLALEFPAIEIKNLQGYHISYGKKGLFLSLFLQLPRIFLTIKRENKWLKELLQKERIDFVISDNRPGLHNKKATCIYITHQLLIQSGKGKWMNHILQKLHHRYIKKFNAVWIPDLKKERNLAGVLSHPLKQLVHPVYIGLLSRLCVIDTPVTKYNLLVLLSGPEPQRTLLEQLIINQLSSFEGNVLLIRGLPGAAKQLTCANPNVVIHNHLTATHLQNAIQESELIICRSGYTTLMDLIKLRKKAILIPTPGQPEQEYLAAYMQEQTYFPFVLQQNFSLETAVNKAAAFSYNNIFTTEDFEHYRQQVQELISTKK